MMRNFLSALLLFTWGEAHAEPHVVGYERFHLRAPSAQGGAILFSELGCANCHGGSQVIIPRKGPSFENLSIKVSPDWGVKFLQNPETYAPFEPKSNKQAIQWSGAIGKLLHTGSHQLGLRQPKIRQRSVFRTIEDAACLDPAIG